MTSHPNPLGPPWPDARADRAERVDYISLVRRMDRAQLLALAQRGRDDPASLSPHEIRIMSAYALLLSPEVV